MNRNVLIAWVKQNISGKLFSSSLLIGYNYMGWPGCSADGNNQGSGKYSVSISSFFPPKAYSLITLILMFSNPLQHEITFFPENILITNLGAWVWIQSNRWLLQRGNPRLAQGESPQTLTVIWGLADDPPNIDSQLPLQAPALNLTPKLGA